MIPCSFSLSLSFKRKRMGYRFDNGGVRGGFSQVDRRPALLGSNERIRPASVGLVVAVDAAAAADESGVELHGSS